MNDNKKLHLENLKERRDQYMRVAEAAALEYYQACELGDELERAQAVYKNLRNANPGMLARLMSVFRGPAPATIDDSRISDGKIDERMEADVPEAERLARYADQDAARGARHGVPCSLAGICSQPALCCVRGCAKFAGRR